MQSHQEYGIIWRDIAQGFMGGIVGGPFSFVPTPTHNPFACGRGSNSLFDQGHCFFFISYVFQVQPQQALPE